MKTALEFFDAFFQTVKNPDYTSTVYNGLKIYSIRTESYRKFVIAFDVETGRLVWEDIEIDQ